MKPNSVPLIRSAFTIALGARPLMLGRVSGYEDGPGFRTSTRQSNDTRIARFGPSNRHRRTFRHGLGLFGPFFRLRRGPPAALLPE